MQLTSPPPQVGGGGWVIFDHKTAKKIAPRTWAGQNAQHRWEEGSITRSLAVKEFTAMTSMQHQNLEGQGCAYPIGMCKIAVADPGRELKYPTRWHPQSRTGPTWMTMPCLLEAHALEELATRSSRTWRQATARARVWHKNRLAVQLLVHPRLRQ